MKTKQAAAIVIEDNLGRVFLTQRGREARDEYGKWENCGGGVENGETSEDAITREVFEELGASIKIIKSLYKDIFETDSGVKWEVTVFKGEFVSNPSVQNYSENSGFGWFAKSELKNLNLTSYTRKDFEKFGWI